MAIDIMYTNGVIAAREKFLLKDKIFRISELSAEEAFRAILETGYGQGAEGATDVYSFEKLVVAEERAVDAFIAEYAPNRSVVAYLLAPRDFHNAKAILKAKYLGVGFDNMLGSEGEICISVLSDCIMSGDYSKLAKQNQILASAIEDAQNLLNDGETSGAKIGDVFERAAYCYYAQIVKHNGALKKLLARRVDMTNILIALRSQSSEEAAEKYLSGGLLKESTLGKIFVGEEEARAAFSATEYKEFFTKAMDAKSEEMPLTEAEKLRDSYELVFFDTIKYELKKDQPFLYYVFRRRIENMNVRILFVCLLAGLNETEIKKRLRAI